MKPEDETTTAAAAAAGAPPPPPPPAAKTPFIGRHRLQAALSLFDQQLRIFQDELNELDSIGGPSTVCDELISGVESAPDPLLPTTKGPVDASWERWFGGGGGGSSRSHRRWI